MVQNERLPTQKEDLHQKIGQPSKTPKAKAFFIEKPAIIEKNSKSNSEEPLPKRGRSSNRKPATLLLEPLSNDSVLSLPHHEESAQSPHSTLHISAEPRRSSRKPKPALRLNGSLPTTSIFKQGIPPEIPKISAGIEAGTVSGLVCKDFEINAVTGHASALQPLLTPDPVPDPHLPSSTESGRTRIDISITQPQESEVCPRVLYWLFQN